MGKGPVLRHSSMYGLKEWHLERDLRLEPPNLKLFAETSELFVLSFLNFPPSVLSLLEFSRNSFRRKLFSLSAPHAFFCMPLHISQTQSQRAGPLPWEISRYHSDFIFLRACCIFFLVEHVSGHSKLTQVYT